MRVRGCNIAVERYLYLILLFSALAGFALLKFGVSSTNGLIPIISFGSEIVAIDVFVVIIFSKWLWRLKPLHPWLVPFPNLNGEWAGKISSTWVDEGGNGVNDIDATLTIKQTFFSISCVMKTAEMTSYSFAEGFRIEEERQLYQLCYSYTTKPKAKFRKQNYSADGTILFDIQSNPKMTLEGEYWTQKKTTGSASFNKI